MSPSWRTLAEYSLRGLFAKSLILARVSSKRRRCSAENEPLGRPVAVLDGDVPVRDHLQPDSNTLRDIARHIPWLGCRLGRPIEGSGADGFASLPGPEHGAKVRSEGLSRRLLGPIALHCSCAVRLLALDARHPMGRSHLGIPALPPRGSPPHSNSTLTSQPVPAHAGIPQDGDRGPVQRDHCPTIPQHGSSFLCRLPQRRAANPTSTFDYALLMHCRSGPPCGFWCPSRHAPTSTYVQRNCR